MIQLSSNQTASRQHPQPTRARNAVSIQTQNHGSSPIREGNVPARKDSSDDSTTGVTAVIIHLRDWQGIVLKKDDISPFFHIMPSRSFLPHFLLIWGRKLVFFHTSQTLIQLFLVASLRYCMVRVGMLDDTAKRWLHLYCTHEG